MKKFKILMLFTACTVGFSSCTLYSDCRVNSNPVGPKVGVAKQALFKPNQDWSFKKAAENGKINKIGSSKVEIKTACCIIPYYKTTVTGE